MTIHLELHVEEVNAMLHLLGQLPTQTNVWPLCAKIRQQAEVQLPKPAEQVDGEGNSAN